MTRILQASDLFVSGHAHARQQTLFKCPELLIVLDDFPEAEAVACRPVTLSRIMLSANAIPRKQHIQYFTADKLTSLFFKKGHGTNPLILCCGLGLTVTIEVRDIDVFDRPNDASISYRRCSNS